jgi:hypothetical protein
MDDTAAWALEKRFWLEGADFYNALLDPSCLMAFPGIGVMRAGDVLDSLKAAPRWSSVEIMNGVVGRPKPSMVILGYTAEGKRLDVIYRAFCTSTYCSRGGKWKLVQHQQTLAASS